MLGFDYTRNRIIIRPVSTQCRLIVLFSSASSFAFFHLIHSCLYLKAHSLIQLARAHNNVTSMSLYLPPEISSPPRLSNAVYLPLTV